MSRSTHLSQIVTSLSLAYKQCVSCPDAYISVSPAWHYYEYRYAKEFELLIMSFFAGLSQIECAFCPQVCTAVNWLVANQNLTNVKNIGVTLNDSTAESA